MKEITAYQTVDLQIFDNLAKAREHEDELVRIETTNRLVSEFMCCPEYDERNVKRVALTEFAAWICRYHKVIMFSNENVVAEPTPEPVPEPVAGPDPFYSAVVRTASASPLS